MSQRITDVLGVIALAAVLTTTPGCDLSDPAPTPTGTEAPAPATPERVSHTDGPAQIRFDAPSHDFGVMPETETRSTQLRFANVGGQPLLIETIKTTCGCTAATPDKQRYEPGEVGYLNVTFDPSAPGQQKKYVNVFTNSPQRKTEILITADVQAFVTIVPRMLKLGVRQYGKQHQGWVTVTCQDPAFEILSVRTTNPYISAIALPNDGSGERTVEITVPSTTPWGGQYGFLEITARGLPTGGTAPLTHTSKVRISTQLFGDIVAQPDTFRFGVKPGESFERRIVLARASGEAYEVLAATPSTRNMPNTSVRIEKISDSEYHLYLTSTGNDRPAQYGGTVRVRTNVAGEE